MEHPIKKDRVMKMAIAVLVGVVLVFVVAILIANHKMNSQGVSKSEEREDSLSRAIVNVGGSHLIASVADTPLARTQGLSNVHAIGPNEGKLFVFEEEGYPEFWMKDMKFNIDIIWINSMGTVVDILENVAPNTYPASFKPAYPASKVLEVNAGWASEHKVKVGDQMIWTELKQ